MRPASAAAAASAAASAPDDSFPMPSFGAPIPNYSFRTITPAIPFRPRQTTIRMRPVPRRRVGNRLVSADPEVESSDEEDREVLGRRMRERAMAVPFRPRRPASPDEPELIFWPSSHSHLPLSGRRTASPEYVVGAEDGPRYEYFPVPVGRHHPYRAQYEAQEDERRENRFYFHPATVAAREGRVYRDFDPYWRRRNPTRRRSPIVESGDDTYGRDARGRRTRLPLPQNAVYD